MARPGKAWRKAFRKAGQGKAKHGKANPIRVVVVVVIVVIST